MSAVFSGSYRLIVFVLLFMMATISLKACDSTIIELLTGSSAQKDLTARILAISQRMQQAAGHLKSYNHAAAASLHREVMEHWLYVASQIGVNKVAAEEDQKTSSQLMILVSKDLGLIRRKLDSSDLLLIHEIVEACITRMALITAIVNRQPRITAFLELELALYKVRPFANSLEAYSAALASSGFSSSIEKILPKLPSEFSKTSKSLEEAYQQLLASVGSDSGHLSKETIHAQQQLLNLFVGFKHNLLKTDFFKPQ